MTGTRRSSSTQARRSGRYFNSGLHHFISGGIPASCFFACRSVYPDGPRSLYCSGRGPWTAELLESGAAPRYVCWAFAMNTEHTTAIVQRYLEALDGDEPAEPIVRALLGPLGPAPAVALRKSPVPRVPPPDAAAAEPAAGRDALRRGRAAAQGDAFRPPPDGAPVLRPGQPAYALGAQ